MTNTVVHDVWSVMDEDNAADSAGPSVNTIARDEVNQLVDDLAHTVARTLADTQEKGYEQREWLAILAALTAIRTAADELSAHAAAQAALHGAKYPALAEATGMTRQNARVKWPGLVPPLVRKSATS
jgi:hypothetical protein